MAGSCKGGRIAIEEFARFLKLPVTPPLEELFALFDRVREFHINHIRCCLDNILPYKFPRLLLTFKTVDTRQKSVFVDREGQSTIILICAFTN